MNHIPKILVTLAFLGALCFSQTSIPNGAVVGCVYNLESNSPLADGFVQIDNLNLSVVSSSSGKFIVLNVPPGVYDIRAGSTGGGFYQKRYLRVRVASDSVTILGFGLTNIAIPEKPLPVPWDMSIKRIESSFQLFGRGKIFDFQCGL